jgi:hypothetical protein
MNINVSNRMDEESQINSFKTPHGTPLTKEFIRKTEQNPDDGFYLKNINAKFKGRHNIRKGSYN